MEVIKGKTSSGFEFVIDEEVRDDMELLDNLIKMDKGDLTGLTDVMVALLGEEQKKAFYEHHRKENGRVSATAVMAEVKEMFAQIGKATKN